MRASDSHTYKENRDGISHDWCNFLSNFPITPIFVPNALVNPCQYFESLNVKGLLLTGGESIGDLKDPSKKTKRDHTEYLLLDYAIKNKIPVLGVCRGLQLINLYFGGTTAEYNSENHKHVCVNHEISFVIDHLNMVSGNRVTVNSFHKNGVLNKNLGKDLIPVAYSEDGLVECLKHRELKICAVQWHLERCINESKDFDFNVMKHWLSLCE